MSVVIILLLTSALALLFAIAWFDARYGRVHDGAVLALAAFAIAYRVTDGSFAIDGALVGLIVFGLLWLPGRGRCLGAGDVGLGIAIGLLCGSVGATAFAIGGAFILGALVVIIGLLAGRLHRGDRLPFAPLLAVGTAISLMSWTHAAAWLAVRGW
ncbi:MAG: hypothetical protein KBC95_03890 [Candidatus Peribacteraceae bacterium]|nr:hypothetical protein [Candidatus Peribacteraceae bacterium]